MAKAKVSGNTEETKEFLQGEGCDAAEIEEADAVPEKKPSRAEVVVPKYLFTTDPDEEHHVVCANGRVYQVKYDEAVMVPPIVADIINNAIAQKKKVRSLIRSMSGRAKEIQ